MPIPGEIASWLPGEWSVWALVLARVAGLAWIAPGWGAAALGWRLRLLLVMLLTAILVPAVGATLQPPAGLAELGQACLAELLAGAALGWTASLVVAGARQAGEIVGVQAGLSPAALLDPDADSELTALGHLYGLMALGVFLALDGPLALVGALVESYRAIPAGGLSVSPELAGDAMARVGQALALSVRLAAPAATALMLAGGALGLLSRAAPSLQLLALALPVRWGVGLVFVLIGMATLAFTLAAAWDEVPLLGPLLPVAAGG